MSNENDIAEDFFLIPDNLAQNHRSNICVRSPDAEQFSLAFLQERDSRSKQGQCKILLVEDNTFNSFAIESLFIQFNQQCEICTNGNEAIKMVNQRIAAKQSIYKIILMDFSMPECDGAKATKIIR